MNKRHGALLLGLLIAPIYLLWGPGAADMRAPEPAEAEAPASRALVATRVMADYLEVAPPQALRALAGSSAAPVAAQAPAVAQPSDATETGLAKVEDVERRISQHYPQTETGALIRHYVALALSDVDTDYRPDLSRVRALNDLMQNASSAAADLTSALSSLGPDESGSESERAALVQLAAHVGSNEAALPAVEGILAAEISRKSGLDENANEARLLKLVDSYTMLVADPRKQADFVRAGIQAQQDEPRLRQALETALDNLAGAHS